ncbi:MAG: hypothetical protein FJY81_02590 [Candidatus Aminicenantes bacterium]|nr:hypothetical protein [Candidatus Aminicenantes bacterium]
MTRLRSLVLKHFETALIVLILLGIVAIAFLVHYKTAFLNFFFLPVILAGYYLGKRQAVLAACLCVLLVAFYFVLTQALLEKAAPLSLDDILNLVTWAGFLVLTAGVIGTIAEQREARIKKLERTYIGVLEILLKYLEVADERKPHSLRVSLLAGKIADALGLTKFQVENIKSAALLLESGDLRSNIPLFEEVAAFMGAESRQKAEKRIDDRERVLLKTTASLLKEIEPLLRGYFYYYVEEADILDKDLNAVPLGSSIIALADLYDRVASGIPAPQWKDKVSSVEDIRRLSGRAFPAMAVEALFQVTGAF